ncbi:unnamed protein product [Brassica oleracea]|uniref:(rape) hypothetical protein n=1 Tax=Brassica napus TaxID=3708 RepID=A0A816JHQ1_BRANA|nr:unnamed protein product [Brassica napus]
MDQASSSSNVKDEKRSSADWEGPHGIVSAFATHNYDTNSNPVYMVETRHGERVPPGFEQEYWYRPERRKISSASPSGASDFAGGGYRGEF